MPNPAGHTFNPAAFDAMHAEHAPWLTAVDELRAVGIEINDAERLHAALTVWGEELAALRATTPDQAAGALADRRKLAASVLT